MALTHEKIDKSKPEDLPHMVATHVMGWVWGTPSGYSDLYPCWHNKIQPQAYTWSPIEDANDALRVVDKMMNLGQQYEMYSTESHSFHVAFGPHSKLSIKHTRHRLCIDKSLCIAICRAALHAVVEMGEVEN